MLKASLIDVNKVLRPYYFKISPLGYGLINDSGVNSTWAACRMMGPSSRYLLCNGALYFGVLHEWRDWRHELGSYATRLQTC